MHRTEQESYLHRTGAALGVQPTHPWHVDLNRCQALAFGFTFKKYHLIYQGDALQALWCGAELAETFLPHQIKISPATGCTQAVGLLRVP